jgi:HD superfamily phosphodiesterase
MEGTYSEVFNLAKPYLDTRENEIHTKIAYAYAVKLLQAEGGDEAVVLPAVILHDVGWKSIPEELQLKAFGPAGRDEELKRAHEVESANIGRKILEQVGYDSGLIEEIVEIISGHDTRKSALSLNDALAKDADKLWRFSETALQVDPQRFGIDPAVHLAWLKREIDRWFFTETAKEIARNEHKLREAILGVPPEEREQE